MRCELDSRKNSHGDIVGDDSLFLELKLLEGVGLEDLFDLWEHSGLAITGHSFFIYQEKEGLRNKLRRQMEVIAYFGMRAGQKLTEAPDIVGT